MDRAASKKCKSGPITKTVKNARACQQEKHKSGTFKLKKSSHIFLCKCFKSFEYYCRKPASLDIVHLLSKQIIGHFIQRA